MGQFLKYIWYYTCGWPCRFFCLMFFGMRFFGVENIPKKGGFILLCNHQCWLDPMFVVVPVVRRCVFAARDSLFRVPLFGWFFKVYNCIPIKRNHSDIAAIRECIEKLKSGFGLVLYPEGTRTANGKINRLKPGFNLLAKRASVPIIPVVIDGAFESWPRSRRIFSPGRVFIQYGEPINPQEIAAETDKEFMAELNQRMRKMQAELRIKAGRVPFDYTPCEKPGNLSQEDKSVLPDQQTSQQPQKISFFKSAAKKINFDWYALWRSGCRIFCRICFKPEAFNKQYVPEKGGFLLLSNHQSFLDPMINANPLRRQCCFAARSTLFDIPIFGRLVHSFNAIPIKRGQADLAAMKMFVEKLKEGYGLVLYPEGTRTEDGKIAEMKPGFGLLARKANIPVVPSVIDGAYECWPRHKKIFSRGKIYVTYGPPIPAEKIAEMGDREFAKYLTQILRDMQRDLRLKVGRKPFVY
ncbi:MAG: 1-acyl-sn-glycerol-3-phosphate acyltransferase [Planctomycetes bacterium ADurb.Bin401]|nr:MAG: 1-acyl-sn-glycerol-3-phosphate acyltransferase [Planctomycetes bacterium ADurb.Bin401]